jgi:hypothetical protein
VEQRAGIEAVRRQLDGLVRSVGWAVVMVGPCGPTDADGEAPAFAYTVGLADRGHPELMVMGFAPDVAQPVLNAAAQRVKEGVRFQNMSSDDKVVQGYPVMFRAVKPPHARRWARAASERRRPKHFELLQMFLPDPSGLFPWQAGCATDYARLQGLLLGEMLSLN